MMIKNTVYRVKDWMQTDVMTISPNATFTQAVATMVTGHTNGLVVAEKGIVHGILSSMDLIRHLVPDYLEEDKHLAAFESGDQFVTRISEIKNDSVKKFMTRDVHTIKSSHTLMEAAILLSEFNIRQIPVVDDAHKLVGYINRTDIKKAIADILELDA